MIDLYHIWDFYSEWKVELRRFLDINKSSYIRKVVHASDTTNGGGGDARY